MPQIRIHVREAQGDLPAVCMRCGEPATCATTKTLSWFPSWVNVLILAGLLPYLIVVAIMTRRAVLHAPFCDAHKGHWFNRNLLIWGTLFLFGFIIIGALVAGGSAPHHMQDTVMPIVCTGSALLIVTWLIVVITAQYTAIRPSEITDREIQLEGVSAGFVAAIDEIDQERRERRRQREQSRRDRWEDEEDAWPEKRPRRDPSSENIQE